MATWQNASDFDDVRDEGGVEHEIVPNTDHGDDTTLDLGGAYADPLTHGLVGWWPLHWTGSTAPDLAGNNDGSVTGTVPGVAGRGGLRARKFDGSDDHIDLFHPSTPFTFTCWAKSHVADGTNDQVLSFFSDSDYAVTLRNYQNNWEAWSGSAITGPSVTVGEWVMLAATWNGSTFEFYHNANSQGTSSSLGTTSTILDTIGGDSDNGHLFNGAVCDVRVYDRPLSASEIQTLYEWGSIDIVTPTDDRNGGISYWKLDEDSGSTASDSWGSNDGSVNGATVGAGGIRDTSFSFDGSNDNVDLGTISEINGVSSFSVSTWVKLNGTTNGNSNDAMRIFAGRADWDNWLGLSYRGDGNSTPNTFSFAVDNGGTFVSAGSNGTYSSTSNWYHLVGTFDSGAAQLYINAERDGYATGGASTTPTVSDSHFIGNIESSYNQVFNGRIDDLRLYSRVLDPREVHELYRFGTRGIDMTQEIVNR